MQKIEELIQYENECVYLEYKAVQFKRENYVSFIKTVLSMANAKYVGDKYIIVGVKFLENGEREFWGVNEALIHAATFQLLIHENIEPEIPISYNHFTWQEKVFGVFTIGECRDKPYMMKKDYSELKRGAAYIRKGSFQTPLLRADVDDIMETKVKKPSFVGKVGIFPLGLENTDGKLAIQRHLTLPSDMAAEEIKTEMAKREGGKSPEKVKFERGG
jgi:predicted HTH transcriptional regulator